MSLTANIVLPDSLGVNKTFVDLQRKGFRWERLRDDTTLAAPSMFVIDHTTTKTKGGIVVDRHLIQVATTENLPSGEQTTVVVNFTISVPRNLPASSTAPKDAVCFIGNFINSASTVTLEAAFNQVLAGQS